MEKNDIRKKYIKLRKEMSLEDIEQKSLIIQNKFLNSDFYKNSNIICCYLDFKSEVKTNLIIKKSFEDGKKVYVPKIIENGLMEFFLINEESNFEINKFKILEPEDEKEKFENVVENVIFLVPGVAFSNEKFRIGYGGGFYDRWIENSPQYSYIGLSYEMQIIDDFEVNKFDKKLDYIITENKIF